MVEVQGQADQHFFHSTVASAEPRGRVQASGLSWLVKVSIAEVARPAGAQRNQAVQTTQSAVDSEPFGREACLVRTKSGVG